MVSFLTCVANVEIWVVKMSVDLSQIRWERRRKAPFAPSYLFPGNLLS